MSKLVWVHCSFLLFFLFLSSIDAFFPVAMLYLCLFVNIHACKDCMYLDSSILLLTCLSCLLFVLGIRFIPSPPSL